MKFFQKVSWFLSVLWLGAMELNLHHSFGGNIMCGDSIELEKTIFSICTKSLLYDKWIKVNVVDNDFGIYGFYIYKLGKG